MKVLGPNGYLEGVALFCELTDEQLERVRIDKNYIFDMAFLKECNYARGDNALFYGLISNGGNQKIIYKHLKQLLKEYKTVSWWDRNREKFITTRRKEDVSKKRELDLVMA
jgi:hypothetical protein